MSKMSLVICLLILGFGGLWALKFYAAPEPWAEHSAEAKLAPTQEQEQAPLALENALENAYVFPKALGIAPFALIDQNQQPFTEVQLQGKWSLFFIGFTSCPDVCPTTLNKLSAAYGALSAIAPLQIIFLSVDPARDTPDKLLSYMNFFNPDFKALTGEQAQIFPLSRSLGLTYAMVGDGENYQVDHSAGYVLVSPKGERVAVFKPAEALGQVPHIPNSALINDFRKIAAHH
ncbi:MAG: SCO family protein [Shewanella sp.]